MIRSPHFTLCLTDKQFRAELDRLKCSEYPLFQTEGADAATHWLEFKGKPCAIVCLHLETDDPIVIAGLLVHEATHIYQGALRKLSNAPDPGGEIQAYAIQWISQNLMWEFRRQTKGRKWR